MKPERYQRIRRLVHAAEGLSAEERGAFLDAACVGDTELREAIEELIATDDVATADLAEPLGATEVRELFGEGVEHVLPERLGPFRIVGELGRGGMGVVLDAIDERTDMPVALKLVHTHLVASRKAHDRFQREARLGASVRHENVVRTLGLETLDVDGAPVPVLVMERVQGVTLRRRLTDWGRVPEALVREIGRQVSAGLQAIHAAGIVHRDLKPDNVLVTGDEHVRIMDLGIAAVQEATVELTREGQFVGSLQYAAPEQFDGGDIGPAADLYALGVTLHELVSGANPFAHEQPAAIIAAHLRGEGDPRRADAGVSPFLAELLDTLLARDPAQRRASAGEVATILAEGEDGDWWRERSNRRDAATNAPLVPVGRKTGLHGRDADLDWLRSAWNGVREGRGGVVLVEGEAGIGKTRLLDALVEGVLGDDAHVLYGAFCEGSAQCALTEAFSTFLGAERLEDGLARLLDEPDSVARAYARLIREEELPSPEFGGDLIPLCARLVRGLAAERPTLWIVDDLQSAPAESLTAVLALARTAPDTRALVVLASRPGVTQSQGGSLAGVPGLQRRTLGRLSPREVVDVLREALGSDALADHLGGKVARKSDGVPFFVFEMLHMLEEDGSLTRTDDGRFVQTRHISDVQVPSAVRDLIAVRLADLGREEREALDVAAVVGAEFDSALVAQVLGRSLVRVLQDLAELERRHGIVRSSGRLHRFDHAQFRDVLYGALPDRLRTEYHALVADTHASLQRLTGPAQGADAVFLTSHHLRGSRTADALQHIDAALAHLRSRHHGEQALELLGAALTPPTLVEGVRRAELSLAASELADGLGRRDEQEKWAEEALRIARADGDATLGTKAAMAAARHAHSALDLARLDACLEEAAREATLSGDGALEIEVALMLARGHVSARRTEEAFAEIERAEKIAERTGNVTAEARLQADRANVLLWKNRWGEAVEPLDRAIELLTGDGTRPGLTKLALAHSARGTAYWALAEPERARDDYEQALALGRRLGLRRVVGGSEGRLGLVSLHAGRLADAVRQFRLHHEISLEIGDIAGVGQALANLGHTRALLGEHDVAFSTLGRAADVAASIDARRMSAFVRLQRAEVLRETKDFEGALAEAQTAREFGVSSDDVSLETAALLELGNIAFACGDRDGAAARIEEVCARARKAGPKAHRIELSAQLSLGVVRGDDVTEAAETLAPEADRLGTPQRVLLWYNLWKTRHDPAALENAWTALTRMSDHAPPDRRDAVFESSQLHRDVTAAWRSRTTGPA